MFEMRLCLEHVDFELVSVVQSKEKTDRPRLVAQNKLTCLNETKPPDFLLFVQNFLEQICQHPLSCFN